MNPHTLTHRLLSLVIAFIVVLTEGLAMGNEARRTMAYQPAWSSMNSLSSPSNKPLINKTPTNEPEILLKSLLHGVGYLEKFNTKSVSSKPWVLNIKDVHQNEEAQRNIVEMLKRLVDKGMIDLIFLEGYSGPMDLSIYRNPPDKQFVQSVAENLLMAGRISGPAYFGITAASMTPPMIGLEEGKTYEFNIDMARRSVTMTSRIRDSLLQNSQNLEKLKKLFFDPDLHLIDLGMKKYQEGRISLTSFLYFLLHRGAEPDKVVAAIIEAGDAGRPHLLRRATSQMKLLLGRFGSVLSDREMADLFNNVVQFQQKKISGGQFSSILQDVSERNKISMKPFEDLVFYLTRISLTDSLPLSDISSSVNRLRDQLLNKLADSAEEKDLLRLSRYSTLIKKLALLSLTPDEWVELNSYRIHLTSNNSDIQKVGANLQKTYASMAFHKVFYRLAEQRNDHFVKTIASASIGHANRGVVVVTGGFHSDAVGSALSERGFTFLTCVPKLSDFSSNQTTESLLNLINESKFPIKQNENLSTLAPNPMPPDSHLAIGASAAMEARVTGNNSLGEWGARVLRLIGIQVKGNTEAAILTSDQNELGTVDEHTKTPLTVVWHSFLRLWYEIFGLNISGVTLHGNKKVNIRIFPRPRGNGINFIRVDLKDRALFLLTIPARLNFLKRNRHRFTGIEHVGIQVATVEHLLFAFRVLGIWNADVRIAGQELPILDGAASQYIKKLNPLKKQREAPDPFRFPYPLSYRRDDNTAIVVLPLRPDEEYSEFIFVGNYPGYNLPIESRIVFDENKGMAKAKIITEIGSRKTFVEKPLKELQEKGFFHGAIVNENIIQLLGEGQLKENPGLARKIAEHKGGIDLMGDMFLVELANGKRFRGVLIALGTGHRDMAELMYRMQSGYQLPIGYDKLVNVNLEKLRSEGKISGELYKHIRERLDPYKNYDDELLLQAHQLSEQGIQKLTAQTRLMEDSPSVEIQECFNAAKKYLLSAHGSVLYDIADNISTLQFVPEQIQGIDFRFLREESETEAVFEVSFVRQYGGERDWPKIALVVSKIGHTVEVQGEGSYTKLADEDFEKYQEETHPETYVPRRASDQRMEYFPKVGRMRSIEGAEGHQYIVYPREWYYKDHARIVPFLITHRNYHDQTPFGALWVFRDEPFWQPLTHDLQKKVAWGVAEMLTTIFLRVFQGGHSPGLVPQRGRIIADVDTGQDIFFDPVAGKVALARVKGVRMVQVEDLLNQIFHLTYGTEEKGFNPAGKPVIWRTETHFLARFIEDLIQGVIDGLIKEFGELEGRIAAVEWFINYQSFLSKNGNGDPHKDPSQTWIQRRIEHNIEKNVEIFLGGTHGPSLHLYLSGTIAKLQDEIIELKTRNSVTTGFGTVRWLAHLLSDLTDMPMETWIRWAALTESIVFPVAGALSGIFMGMLFSNSILGLFTGFFITQVIWVASHQSLLIQRAGSDGGLRYEWVPVDKPENSRLSSEKIRSAYSLINWLGIVYAALPAALIIGSWPMGLVAMGLAFYLHEYHRRQLGKGENASDAWLAKEILSTRRRQDEHIRSGT